MVSSIGSNSMASMAGLSRHDPSRMASNVFSKLDTKGQGYIEESDLQSAFSQIGSTSSSSTENDSAALFKALDGDSDGKVTESEFSSSLQKLADALDSQAFGSRMAGAMPPPPPPPEGDDAGFTQEELSSQLEEIGSTDSQRSELISKVVENFEAADANGDGKVSASEAMAYERESASTSDSATASTSSSDSSTTDAALAQRLMDLMRAYSGDEGRHRGSVAVSA
ncbi:EF-hand domain-containing protein [Zoogloea sp.]|uniref:EF-hand domain-containing protein n=1 Tax=Zoogloea sp. TaxID=49181 RepID=UPI001AD2D3B2|nr:EF-hand domain-containing protein [Zoogloea sp.]MBN8285203.1 EF-hand domain-containing protein [Zoogloea sp.]